jgi:hypothetical protein
MRYLQVFSRPRGFDRAKKTSRSLAAREVSLGNLWKLCGQPHDFSPSRPRQLDHELSLHEHEQRETLSNDRLTVVIRETNMIGYPVRVQRRAHRAAVLSTNIRVPGIRQEEK